MGWLESVSELVAAHPESITGPNGERVSVSYGHHDAIGRPYVTLTGFSERHGHNLPLEVEIVPGARVPLSDVQITI
jgi:hypothetical protein